MPAPRLDWRKQPSQGFIPTTWIGSHDGRDLFGVSYQVRCVQRYPRKLNVFFRLYRIGGGTINDFPKLADAKAYAWNLILL